MNFFEVVGSDGLYDGLSNAEIAKIAIEKDISEEKRSYKMLRKSLENQSSDNMAAIVIDLNVPEPDDPELDDDEEGIITVVKSEKSEKDSAKTEL